MQVDVLIVGGGFGGAFAARELDKLLSRRDIDVLLVSPENFLLFSPLLPEAASGTLEPRHAVVPLREMLTSTSLMIGEVTDIDVGARTATVVSVNGDRETIRFREAVLSPGAVPSVFAIPGLHDHAVGFKTLADAIWLRNRVVRQLDAADAEPDPGRRRELLTFTFVGGGYAGVEALAELESFARDAVKAHPRLAIHDCRWVLVEATNSLLPGLDPRLARFTESSLRRRGVEVRLGTRLVSCVDGVVNLSDDGVLPYRSETIVWTAGQTPSPVAARWNLESDDRGFVPVDDRMAIPGIEGIYAVGDFAAVPEPDGGLAPSTAQHALRQARVAAKNIAQRYGVGDGARYRYRTRGLAVTLGKWQGTAQVRRFTFTGPLAWWMGRSYHLLMIPGLGRKLRVVADWTMALLFRRDIAQLGQLGTPSRLPEP